MERGDFEPLPMLAAECETAANASGDLWYQTLPLFLRGYGAIGSGDYRQAGELFERLIALNRRTGDTWVVCMGLSNLAMVRILQRQYVDARTRAVEGILRGRELGDRVATGW